MLNAEEYVATAKALGIYCNDGGFNTDNYKVITRTGMVNNHYLALAAERHSQTIVRLSG